MSRAALTLMIYAVGFGAAGAALLLVPDPVLTLFGFPQTQDVWIHLIGLLMVSLAAYDIVAAQNEIGPIIAASVPGRLFAGGVMVATWALDMVGPGILVFAAVDVAGALATMLAMRGPSLVKA